MHPLVANVHARAAQIAQALGPYRFYVYDGPAVDNMTTALSLPPVTARYANVPSEDASRLSRNIFPEYTAAVWVHRALLADPLRTLDPEQADLFFAPAYLAISAIQPGHSERLAAWLEFVGGSVYYRRRLGADHLFAASDVRDDARMELHGHGRVRALLGRGYSGTFELRAGWSGGWDVARSIVMPYVANPFLTPGGAAPRRPRSRAAATPLAAAAPTWSAPARVGASAPGVADGVRDITLFYVAHVRALGRVEGGCNREIMTNLSGFDPSVVAKVGWQMMTQLVYARRISRARFCPLTCGDTATSRRTFDAMAAGCIPILVGSRLWGRCDAPCRGTVAVGAPHLPFEGLWMNWSHFPQLDEGFLYAQRTRDDVQRAFRAVIERASVGPTEEGLRAYLNASRALLVYGWGDYRTSRSFGLASRRLVESALLRRRRVRLPRID